MKTPIDATGHAGATTALLNSGADFAFVDLWIITLNGGTVVRWHGGPQNSPNSAISSLTFTTSSSPYSGTYVAGPPIERGKITTKVGVEVATLEMKISTNASDLMGSAAVTPFVTGRGLDGATVILLRGYFSAGWGSTIIGATIQFSGRVTEVKDLSRAGFTVTVSSWMVLLNVNMGPDVFQAGCLNTHYDANCGLTPSNVTGTVSAGATTLAFNSNLTQADHFFDKGIVTFTSGNNAGVSRAVQTFLHALGAFTVAYPLPFAPASGDTFTTARGCLLTIADCTAQGNLIHFRGQPFTPPAVTGVISG